MCNSVVYGGRFVCQHELKFFKSFSNKPLLEKFNMPVKKIEIKETKFNKFIKYTSLLTVEGIKYVNTVFNVNKEEINYLDVSNCNVFTVFSDGSVFENHNYSVASTATVILKGNEIICKKTHIINDRVDTNIAEIIAIISAVSYIDEHFKDIKNKLIIVYTDSLFAINIFTRHGYINELIGKIKAEPIKTKSIFLNRSAQRILEVASYYKNKMDLYFSWVKGHQNSEYSILSKYNNVCDSLCRKAIQTHLIQIGLKK